MFVRTRSRPEAWISCGELEEQMLIDTTLVGCLPPAGEGVFDEVPEEEDKYHHWDGGGEVPAYAGVIVEYVYVHAEKRRDLCLLVKYVQVGRVTCKCQW